MKNSENALTLIFSTRTQNMIQILINFTVFTDENKLQKYAILTTLVTGLSQSYGVLVYTKTPFGLEQLGAMIGCFNRSLINIYLYQKFMRFMRSDILQLLNETIKFQQDVVEVMQNLEEAIITKSESGIGFCNKMGLKILQEIKVSRKASNELREIGKFESFDEVYYNDFDIGVFHNTQGPAKSEKLKLVEDKVVHQKVFKIHNINKEEDPKEGPKEGDQEF